MKFLAKIIIIATIFLFGFYIGQSYPEAPGLLSNQVRESEQREEQNEVSLMLDFGNGEIHWNIVEAGVGYNPNKFIKNGGDNIKTNPISIDDLTNTQTGTRLSFGKCSTGRCL